MLKAIRLKGNRQLTERLKECGMPRDILRQGPFDPRHHTLSIRSETEGLKTRRVKKAVQLQHYEDLLETPLGRPYVYVIASNPNDAKASLAAAMVLERAVLQHMSGNAPRHKQLPIWHRVYGNYFDKLRDAERNEAPRPNPSLLILSNIAVDSTAAKIELVRDLLVKFDDTPRILVVTGTDPISFMNQKLRLSLTHCLNLSTAHKVEL